MTCHVLESCLKGKIKINFSMGVLSFCLFSKMQPCFHSFHIVVLWWVQVLICRETITWQWKKDNAMIECKLYVRIVRDITNSNSRSDLCFSIHIASVFHILIVSIIWTVFYIFNNCISMSSVFLVVWIEPVTSILNFKMTSNI